MPADTCSIRARQTWRIVRRFSKCLQGSFATTEEDEMRTASSCRWRQVFCRSTAPCFSMLRLVRAEHSHSRLEKPSASGTSTSGFPAAALHTEVQQTDDGNKEIQQSQRVATVYVHWPFCKSLCTFCNFNKYVRDNVNHTRMKLCLVKEAKTLLTLSGAKTIKSVYFGGGTPSLADPSTICTVLDCISNVCHLKDDAEITLEANPTPAEIQKLRDFKSAGVNRISLGIQSLILRDLVLLGRKDTITDLPRSLEVAKTLFPGRLSIDLLFGRPQQSTQTWKEELKEILPLCDRHVSLYQLTLEKGTPLYQDVMEGKLSLPNRDVMADLYHLAVQVLEEAGFYQYEVSNFSKPGSESQHNLSYWQGISYVGIGPGAHGRFYTVSGSEAGTRSARIQTLEPNAWMTEVEQFGHATRRAVPQSQLEILEEILMLGLRTKQGIPNERFLRFAPCHKSLVEIFSSSEHVQDFLAAELLELDERGMRATPSALSVVDSITPAIILHLEKYLHSSTSFS